MSFTVQKTATAAENLALNNFNCKDNNKPHLQSLHLVIDPIATDLAIKTTTTTNVYNANDIINYDLSSSPSLSSLTPPRSVSSTPSPSPGPSPLLRPTTCPMTPITPLALNNDTSCYEKYINSKDNGYFFNAQHQEQIRKYEYVSGDNIISDINDQTESSPTNSGSLTPKYKEKEEEGAEKENVQFDEMLTKLNNMNTI